MYTVVEHAGFSLGRWSENFQLHYEILCAASGTNTQVQTSLTMCVRSDKRSDKELQRRCSDTGFAKSGKMGVRAWIYFTSVYYWYYIGIFRYRRLTSILLRLG